MALSYDPALRLYEVTGSGGTTRFGYDGSDLIAEYNSSNSLLRRYVHGPGADEPLVWYEGSGLSDRRWFHADERGSVIAISTSGGSATIINAYDEYGIPAATNAGRFQYTGQTWLPELGLYYYKARIYSPTLGRFLQTDPIGYGDGINWYAYVGNDPVNKTDPSGLCATYRVDVYVHDWLKPGPLPAPKSHIEHRGCFNPVIGGPNLYRDGSSGDGGGGSDEGETIVVTAPRRSLQPFRTINGPTIFTHYAEASGETVCLTSGQFAQVANAARQTGAAIPTGDGDFAVPVSFYRISHLDLALAFGSATLFANSKGRPTGFYDYIDYDDKPWGERPYAAEVITRAGDAAAPNGRGYYVLFPC